LVRITRINGPIQPGWGLPVNTARHSSSSLFLGQPTPIPVILVITDEQNSGFTA
jgi:hypothetical protein